MFNGLWVTMPAGLHARHCNGVLQSLAGAAWQKAAEQVEASVTLVAQRPHWTCREEVCPWPTEAADVSIFTLQISTIKYTQLSAANENLPGRNVSTSAARKMPPPDFQLTETGGTMRNSL